MDMVCPYCRAKTRVTNSRAQLRRYQVWRRRQCKQCQAIVTSYERLAPESVVSVNLADGRKLPLAEIAIGGPIYSALNSIDQAEAAAALTHSCLVKIFDTRRAEIDQDQLDRIIYRTLKPYNPRAALRYLANPRVQLDLDQL